jgi:hypothetical protein
VPVDPSGDAYVTGVVSSTDFLTTTGVLQPALAGTSGATDLFVSKLNPTGTALSYSTYLGGGGTDVVKRREK